MYAGFSNIYIFFLEYTYLATGSVITAPNNRNGKCFLKQINIFHALCSRLSYFLIVRPQRRMSNSHPGILMLCDSHNEWCPKHPIGENISVTYIDAMAPFFPLVPQEACG